MKGLKALAKKTKEGKTPLYYSIREDAVSSKPGTGWYHITDLIRENKAQEIERTVKRFLGV